MSSFKDRLQVLWGESASPSAIASEIGMSVPGFMRVWNDGAIPKAETLMRIAEVKHVSLDWLLLGRGESCPLADPAHDSSKLSTRPIVFWPNPDGEPQLAAWESWAGQVDRDVFVPVIYAPRLSAAAGGGMVNYLDEQETEALMFKRSFLQHLGVRPHQVFCMRVKGDSMMPTLADGSIIMVDTAQRLPREGLYVLRSDNELRVKRLQPIPGGKLLIKSDNRAYNDIEVTLAELAENEFEIIGHVVHLNTKV